MRPLRFTYLLLLCSLTIPVAAQQWTFRSPMSTPRTGVATVALDGKIYVLGGEDQFGNVLDTASRYDPATDQWESLPPMDKARVFAASLVYQEKIFIIGGRDSDGDVLDEVEFYDPAENRWESFVGLQEERQGLAAVLRGTSMFVAGGSNEEDQLLESIEVYQETPIDSTEVGWISFEEDDTGGVEDVEVTGVITALDASSITVEGLTFTVADTTEILDDDDTPIVLADLAVGMTVEIEGVRLAVGELVATQIRIEDRGDEAVEVTGVITALDAASITVDLLTFAVTEETEFLDEEDNPITLVDLAVGMTVEVEGVRDVTGALFATRIKIKDSGVEEVAVTGTVTALDASSITVEGLTFTVTEETEILDENNDAITLADLAVGMIVEVEGVRDLTGTLFATRIKIKDEEEEDVKVTGMIEALGSSSIAVEGLTFVVTEETEIFDENNDAITLADLAVGMTVEVQGRRETTGALFATRIEIKDRGEEDVEATGTIEALGSSSITVEGLTFTVTEETEILDENNDAITLADLAVGINVEVRGVRDATGALFATRIRIEDDGGGDGGLAELEFCDSSIDLNVGDTFNIRDYLQVKDDPSASIDWNQVFFTYTEAGANDPTVPPDWNLGAFNAGANVTIVPADTAAGTGNRGQGRFRVYVVRQGQAQFDDPTTFRIDDDRDSEVEDAQCGGGSAAGKRASVSQLGTPRAAFAAVTVGHRVLFMGGFGQRGPLSLVQQLNANDSFEELEPLPTARGSLAAAVRGDSVFVLGGRDGTDQVLADVLLLDPASEAWFSMPRLQTARESCAAAVVEGVLYAFGGRDANGRVLDSVEAFGTPTTQTAVSEDEPVPFGFFLEQNYPNPFRMRTTITFSMAGEASSRRVRLTVYDLQGRRVVVLVDGVLTPGRHTVAWDGTERSGAPVGSGIYFYRLQQGDLEARKMMAIVH